MPAPDAASVLDAARAAGATLACAESLTGGALCAALVEVPGASDTVRGGVVAYAIDVKRAVLGVPQTLLDEQGPVSEAVAVAMARGVRDALSATLGVATTGVAGPEGHGGREPGTVCLAVAWDEGARALTVRLPGDRTRVRSGAVVAGLALLHAVLEGRADEGSWNRGTQLR
ncbi:CinA family protein [Demequina litorisediminis]|uniref:Competence damage-inducible protein A n=1 Tax=Demequina litorisediminis TaxID=1849022 RepID=A0ABQ6IK83_9MICO|nr:CinA family protein [Demequina litorisediminis]GMA37117.1 competence damage-inducible protein A [Demequina litorisediminis]